MILEKTLESPLDCKEIQPVYPKGDQSWVFIGRTDVEAEAPILRPPDAKSQLIGKDPDAGKDWGQEEKGTTEDEMVRQHQWFNGHESEQTLGDGEGQGSLLCCSPWVANSRTWLSDWTTKICYMVDAALGTENFSRCFWNLLHCPVNSLVLEKVQCAALTGLATFIYRGGNWGQRRKGTC